MANQSIGSTSSSSRLHASNLVTELSSLLVGVPSPQQLKDANLYDEPSARKSISLAELEGASAALNKQQWEYIVEERHHSEVCGWPMCPKQANRATGAVALLRRERDRQQGIIEALSSSHFCTTECQTNARLVHRVLPTDPLWARVPQSGSSDFDLKPLTFDWLHEQKSATPQDHPIVPGGPEIAVVEHTPASSSAPEEPKLGRVVVEGYEPKLETERVRVHPPVVEEVGDDDDDDDDAEIRNLFAGKLRIAPPPPLSDFNVAFSTLDSWITPLALKFVQTGQGIPAPATGGPDQEAAVSAPMPDDEALVARRLSAWGMLKPRLSRQLDTLFAARADESGPPVLFDRAAVLRDAQHMVLSCFSFERELAPLKSAHWNGLALTILRAVSRFLHPPLHQFLTQCLQAMPTISSFALAELDAMVALFDI